ncbi:MAG: PAS domain-containing protein [Anaerolineae bacterium]
MREAAEALGLTRRRVTDLLRRGSIPGTARVGRSWLIDRGSFEAYLRARHTGAGDGSGPAGSEAVAIAAEPPADDDMARLVMLARIPEENPNPVLRCSADGAVLYANQAAGSLLEACGGDGSDRLPPSLLEVFHRVVTSDQSELYETGAGERYFALHFVPVAAGHVNIYGQEITERRRVEEALRLSEERFRVAVKNAAFVPAETDRHLRYRWTYNAHPDFDPSAVIGKRDNELEDSQGMRQLVALKQRVLDTGVGTRAEISFDRSDGVRTYDFTAEPMRDRSGAITGVMTAAFDITERKRAEAEGERLLAEVQEARQQAEEAAGEAQRQAALLEAVFESAGDGIFIQAADGSILSANATARRLTGFGEADLAQPVAERASGVSPVRPDGTPYPSDALPAARALRGETVTGETIGFRSLCGRTVWVVNSTVPIRDTEGTVVAVVNTITDITQLRRAQERLEEERQRLSVTLRSIGDGVIATDHEGRVMLMNRAAETMTGWAEAEAAGLPLDEVFDSYNERTGERESSPVRRAIETGLVQGVANHTVLVARDGTRRLLADSAAPITGDGDGPTGIVLVFQDITERHFLEEERAKVNKLESLGVLAGGIAHDFNNLLTGVLGNIVLARMDIGNDVAVSETLQEAERAATRAKGLTQQLLTFARGGEPVKRLLALPEVIVDTASFALRGTPSVPRYDFPADLWTVEADAGQLAQVIQNLAINANEAMPRGGTITFIAENATSAEAEALPVTPGNYVRLTVADEGSGIPKGLESRIFDPYFTTKPSGSGLGLSVVYSIVVKHGGYITVESEPGQGSCFSLYLPAVGAATEAPEPGGTPPTVRRRILVMDDEDIVLRVAKKMLERLGCEVEVAREGRQAVEFYAQAQREGRPFDAVILDLHVPAGLGGQETLSRLRQIDPGVRAIVSTAYSISPVMAHYRRHGFVAAIDKPYTLEQLEEVIATVVSGDPA